MSKKKPASTNQHLTPANKSLPTSAPISAHKTTTSASTPSASSSALSSSATSASTPSASTPSASTPRPHLWQKFKTAFLADQKNYIFLILILIIATILRFYNFRAGMMFQDDQARDALVVADIFLKFDPVFIGPVTSIGNMYLGPFYYYLMLPALFLTYPDPIGPALLIGLLSVLTIFLTYQLGKFWLDKKSALTASLLMTFSMILIQYARFSWNPNPAPLVMVILLWAIWAAYQRNRTRVWWLIGFCLAILTQLHYVYLLAVGVAGFWWLAKACDRQKPDSKKFWRDSLIMFAIILLSFAPQFLFDATHDWLNLRALKNLFIKEQAFATPTLTSLAIESSSSVPITQDASLNFFQILNLRTSQIFGEAIFGLTPENSFLSLTPNVWLAIAGFLIFAVTIYFIVRFYSQKEKAFAPRLLLSFLGIPLIGVSLYQHSVYIHYLLFLMPIIFYLLAFLLQKLAEYKLWGKIATGLIILFIILLNLQNARQALIWHDQGLSADQTKYISEVILDHVAEDETYGLVMVNPNGSNLGTTYRYFLSTLGRPPTASAEKFSPDKLFIVDEGRNAEAALSDSSWDIVVYPTRIISETLQPLLAENGNDLPIYILEKATATDSAPTTRNSAPATDSAQLL